MNFIILKLEKLVYLIKENKQQLLSFFILFYLITTGILESTKISDFRDYYLAAKNFYQLEDIYYLDKAKNLKDKFKVEGLKIDDLKYFKEKLGSYIYPPTFSFLLIPFTFLKYPYASLLWFLINYIAFIFCLFYISKHFQFSKFSSAWLFVLISNFLFIQNHQSNNQVGFLLLFLILFAIFSKNDILSAFSISLAVVIKLVPAIFFIYFLYKKRYFVLFLSVLSFVFWVFLPSLYDHNFNMKMLKNCSVLLIDNFIDNPALRAWKNNQSLSATLSKYFIPSVDLYQFKFGLPFFTISLERLKIINLFISFLFVFSLLYLFFKKIKDEAFISLLFICSLILSGISWLHSFIFLIFPVFYLYSHFPNLKKGEKYFILFVLSLVFIFHKNVVGTYIKDMFFMYSGLLYISIFLYFFIFRLSLKEKVS